MKTWLALIFISILSFMASASEDICSENGRILTLSKELEYGDIYPVNIDTNSEEGRELEKELQRDSQQLADALKRYCIRINMLQLKSSMITIHEGETKTIKPETGKKVYINEVNGTLNIDF